MHTCSMPSSAPWAHPTTHRPHRYAVVPGAEGDGPGGCGGMDDDDAMVPSMPEVPEVPSMDGSSHGSGPAGKRARHGDGHGS